MRKIFPTLLLVLIFSKFSRGNDYSWVFRTIHGTGEPFPPRIISSEFHPDNTPGEYSPSMAFHFPEDSTLFFLFGLSSSDGQTQIAQFTTNQVWEYSLEKGQFRLRRGKGVDPEGYGPKVHDRGYVNEYNDDYPTRYVAYNTYHSGNLPGSRSGTTGAKMNVNEVLMFGGMTRLVANSTIVYVNDVFMYNKQTNLFKWLQGGYNVTLDGWSVVDPTGKMPGGRMPSSLYDGEVLWIIMGLGANSWRFYTPLNTIWTYDPNVNEFEFVAGNRAEPVRTSLLYDANDWHAGNRPQGRDGAFVWWWKDCICIFSGDTVNGEGSKDFSSDLWAFNTTNLQFRNLTAFVEADLVSENEDYTEYRVLTANAAPDFPGGRFHGSVFNRPGDSDSVVIIGGFGRDAFGNKGLLNSIYELKFDTWEFTHMRGEMSVTSSPVYNFEAFRGRNIFGGRSNTGFVQIDSQRAFFYGGFGISETNDAAYLGDMWEMLREEKCAGTFACDPEVCSSHGACENGKCNCQLTHRVGDPLCAVTTCNGILSNLSDVCDKNGRCVDFEKCVCDVPKVSGKYCNTFHCFDKLSNETSSVCSAHGNCRWIDFCQCQYGYSGIACEIGDNYLINQAKIDTGIVLGVLAFVALVVFIITVLLVLAWVIYKNRNKLKKFGVIEDIDVIIEEQRAAKDGSAARLRVKTAFSEIPFEDLRIQRVIGQGGSNTVVYSVLWNGLNAAFKKLDNSFVTNEHTVAEFEKECTLLASLNHPFILKFYGLVSKAPHIGLVMEFCNRGDMKGFLNKYFGENEKKYPFEEKIRMAHEISMGMGYLHGMNIIHRDLKLENVLVTKDYESRIMDFELVLGENYDQRVDLFSYGIMLYMIFLENFRPFFNAMQKKSQSMGGSNAPSGLFNVEIAVANDPDCRPELFDESIALPPWMKELISSLWSHSPDDRKSFKAVGEVLEKHRHGSVNDVKRGRVEEKVTMKLAPATERTEITMI